MPYPFEKPAHAGAAVAAEFIAVEFTGEDVREARLRATRFARVADGLPADPAFASPAEFWEYVDAVCTPVGRIPGELRAHVIVECYRFFARVDQSAGFPVFFARVEHRLTPEQREFLKETLPPGAMVRPPVALLIPRVAYEA